MKICKSCKESKAPEEFSKDSQKSDGLRTYCKRCISVTNRIYIQKNAVRLKKARSTPDYKSAARIWSRKSYKKCGQNYKAKKRIWALNNPEKTKAYEKRYRLKYPEKLVEKNKKTQPLRVAYKKKYPWKIAQYGAYRRAMLLHATPSWLTPADLIEIDKFYKEAQTRSVFHEEKFHVDHIEPLLGKTSCGLHVPWNLQVLRGAENMSKGNQLL